MKKLRNFFTIIVLVAIVWLLFGLIRNPSTIVPFSTAMLMMLVPLILGVWISKKYKVSWTIYGAGMLTFAVSQLFHIGFNGGLLNQVVDIAGISPTTNLFLYGLIFGLSAGLFEETARYITYVRFQKHVRNWKGGLMLGAGHGGMEAMAIGSIVMYVFLQMIILKGLSEDALPGLVGPDNVTATIVSVEAYWNTAWYIHLLPLVERISSMVLHMALSLLVLRAVTKENVLWYFGAIAIHTLTNALGVYLSVAMGAIAAEAAILGFGLLSLGIILAFKKIEPEEIEEMDESLPPPTPAPKPVKITNEKLEDSRYD